MRIRGRGYGVLFRRLVAGIRWPAIPKPRGWLDKEEKGLVPPRKLWLGPDDSIGHYFRGVWEYLAYLTLIADLRREEVVLELGCGHGRTGRGLLSYLRWPGRYVGLDVDRRRIAYAQSRIQAKWPGFEFIWADVRNAHYNPQGSMEAASYAFPFADATFDLVYAASLFTHLLPDDTLNYFRESRRVLKRPGRCLFSFFLLDHYRGAGTTSSPLYEFPHAWPGCTGVAVRDPARPGHLVGYSLSALAEMAAQAGLGVERVIPGLWSENPGWAVNEQDLVLFTTSERS